LIYIDLLFLCFCVLLYIDVHSSFTDIFSCDFRWSKAIIKRKSQFTENSGEQLQ